MVDARRVLQRLVDHAARRIVLAKLQVRIDHVVVGVPFVERFVAARLRRGAVRLDRLAPGADAGEDVRGHVQRVRRIRRDLAVAARRLDALLRDRRVVVAVDEVMRGARMVGLVEEDRLEDLRRLELVGVLLVGRVEVRREDERIERRRLLVARVGAHELLEPLFERLGARPVVHLVLVGEEGAQRRDVVALAPGFQAGTLGGLEDPRALGESGGGDHRGPGEGVVQRRQRPRPVRHAAGGIGLEHPLERRLHLAPGEGVVVGHGEVELGLRGLVAVHFEVHLAELRPVVRGSGQGEGEERGDQCAAGAAVHGIPPLGRHARRLGVAAARCQMSHITPPWCIVHLTGLFHLDDALNKQETAGSHGFLPLSHSHAAPRTPLESPWALRARRVAT